METSNTEKRKADDLVSSSAETSLSQLPTPPAKKHRGNDHSHINPQHSYHNQHRKNKRRGNILTANAGQQAPTVNLVNGLNELKNGLQWLATARFAPEAVEHAQAIQNLIFGITTPSVPMADGVMTDREASTERLKLVSQKEDEGLREHVKKEVQQDGNTIDYTDVPPPFRTDVIVPTTSQPSSRPSPILPYALSSGVITNPRAHTKGALTSTSHPALPSLPTVLPSTLSAETNSSSWPPTLPPISDLAYQSAPFTHASTLPAYIPQTNTNNYECLEFLGDAYLEVIATRLIHSRLTTHTVGQKAHLRETLVCNETLASYSRAYKFDEQVKHTGTEGLPPKQWTKVLADVFEAYIAALILSDPANGFQLTETWLSALWAPKIQEWDATLGQGMARSNEKKDAKAELARLIVQGSAGDQRVEYRETRSMEHIKENNMTKFFMGAFYTGCGYKDHLLGRGEGRSKGAAGIEAAKNALENNMTVIMAIKNQLEEHRKHHKATHAKGNHGQGQSRRNHGNGQSYPPTYGQASNFSRGPGPGPLPYMNGNVNGFVGQPVAYSHIQMPHVAPRF